MPSQWLGSCDSVDPTIGDLSGDDVKVVRYRIIFTKPDLEFSFEERTEVVAYSTNGASLGGLKVSHFISDLVRQRSYENPWEHPNTHERPKLWRENHYPDRPDFPADPILAERQTERQKNYNWQFPKEDERYIEFQYEVLRREPKQDPYYDRDRNRDLRQINNSIDRLANVLLKQEQERERARERERANRVEEEVTEEVIQEEVAPRPPKRTR